MVLGGAASTKGGTSRRVRCRRCSYRFRAAEPERQQRGRRGAGKSGGDVSAVVRARVVGGGGLSSSLNSYGVCGFSSGVGQTTGFGDGLGVGLAVVVCWP